MVFKRNLTPLSRRGKVVKNVGKGAMEQSLPSRSALNTLTQGDPVQRSFQNYAKDTPMMQGTDAGGDEPIGG